MVYFNNFIDFTKFFAILVLLTTWCIPLMYPRHQIIELNTQYIVLWCLQCFYLNSIAIKYVKRAENGTFQQFIDFTKFFVLALLTTWCIPLMYTPGIELVIRLCSGMFFNVSTRIPLSKYRQNGQKKVHIDFMDFQYSSQPGSYRYQTPKPSRS